MNGTKLVVNASSLLLATARARCVFVHVALSVRLPSPRALRRNAYINQKSHSRLHAFTVRRAFQRRFCEEILYVCGPNSVKCNVRPYTTAVL